MINVAETDRELRKSLRDYVHSLPQEYFGLVKISARKDSGLVVSLKGVYMLKPINDFLNPLYILNEIDSRKKHKQGMLTDYQVLPKRYIPKKALGAKQ